MVNYVSLDEIVEEEQKVRQEERKKRYKSVF